MKETDANRTKSNNIYSTYEFFYHRSHLTMLRISKYLPWPGFEPGLLRPQRRVLTTIRSRLKLWENYLFTCRTRHSVLIASAAYKAFLKNVYYLGLHRNTDRARYGTNPLSGKLTRCLVKLINPRPYFSSNVFVGNRNSYSYFKASNLNCIIIAKDRVTLNEPD